MVVTLGAFATTFDEIATVAGPNGSAKIEMMLPRDPAHRLRARAARTNREQQQFQRDRGGCARA
jgi:hypothetical protein